MFLELPFFDQTMQLHDLDTPIEGRLILSSFDSENVFVPYPPYHSSNVYTRNESLVRAEECMENEFQDIYPLSERTFYHLVTAK
jgi:hypothetical protein